MSLAEIHAAIPHRAPFLLVDEIVERTDSQITCRKTFRADEWFFAGHYPDTPIVPGVILCEAAMQAGAILLAANEQQAAGLVPVATRMNDVRFKRIVRPGETIDMVVELVEHLSNAWFLKARVECQGKVAARLEFACALASKPRDE